MEITEEQIQQFRELYKSYFGEEVDEKEIHIKMSQLIDLVSIIYKSII